MGSKSLNLYLQLKSVEDCNNIQQDLDEIVKWSDAWQMSFNFEKCKVMHVGRNNENHQYIMNNQVLQAVTEEKDLGVIFTKDMKPSKHLQLLGTKPTVCSD